MLNSRLKHITDCKRVSAHKVYSLYSTATQHFRVGSCVGLDPQCQNLALGISTCWYLKTRKFALPLTPNLKFALTRSPNTNASQWNIGCVGDPTQSFRVGQVDFMLVIPFFFALGTQRESFSQWKMGFYVIQGKEIYKHRNKHQTV